MLKRIAMIGPIGTGKGTQARILAKKFGFVHLSTGELLRQEIDSGSDLGKHISSIIDGGNLMPDEMVNELMRPYIVEHLLGSFVLDGYPRRPGQADAIGEILLIDAVLNFTISDEKKLIDRLPYRSTCKNCGYIHGKILNPLAQEGICPECGNLLKKRADDSSEAIIRNRIAVYHRESAILIEYYEKLSLLRDIDSEGTIEKVHQRVMEVLMERKFKQYGHHDTMVWVREDLQGKQKTHHKAVLGLLFDKSY